MKKRKARLRGTKTAGKFEQKKLLERIKKIKDNPRLVLPKIIGNNVGKKIYDKVHEEMLLAKKQFEDPPSFFAGLFGKKAKDPLARAYASSLSILDSGAPVMAIARFPHGEVHYVMRGYGISKEKLIGIQNYHHRLWSRFAHVDYVKKYNLFIYALEDGLVCTGDVPNYPLKLWEENCSKLKLGSKYLESNSLNIYCKSLDKEVSIGNKKVQKSKENSYSYFLKDQITVDPDIDFEVRLSTFLSPLIPELKEDIIGDYLKGLITDSQLLKKAIDYQKNCIREGLIVDGQYFVVSNEILDKKDLISKICTNKIDEAIVEDLLTNSRDSLILDHGTLADLTENLWESQGISLVSKISEKAVNDYNGSNSLDILRKLYDKIIKDSLTSDYPKFSNLTESLKFLDKVVKYVKVGEKNKAIKYVDDFNSSNNMTKSVGWSILFCLSSTSSRAWKYTKEEKALGESLADNMKLLLDSDAEGYQKCLETISESIGFGNKLEVI